MSNVSTASQQASCESQMPDLRYKISNKKNNITIKWKNINNVRFFLAFSSLFTLWQCWLGAVCIGIYSSLSNSQQTNLNRQHHSIFKFLLQLEIIFLENRWNMWSAGQRKNVRFEERLRSRGQIDWDKCDARRQHSNWWRYMWCKKTIYNFCKKRGKRPNAPDFANDEAFLKIELTKCPISPLHCWMST